MEAIQPEEKELGKILDLRLIQRMLMFIKPYLRYLILSLVFLLLAIFVELSFPYITKVAIDDHIIKNGRKIQETARTGTIWLNENESFITQKQLEKVDPRLLHDWEQTGKISKKRYYYFPSVPVSKNVQALMAAHPDLFESYQGLALISYDNLKSLKLSELYILRASDFSGITRIALIFLVILLAGAVVNFLQIYLSQYAGQLFMHLMRMKIFTKLQELDLTFFDRNPVGRLVTRATNDVEAINEAFTQVFASLFRDLLLLCGIIVIMLVINWRLALITFTVIPLVIILASYFRIRAREIYRAVRAKLAKLNANLQEYLSGIRVIKIFNQEKESQVKFDTVNAEYLRENLKEVTLLSFFRPLIEVVSSLGIGLVLYYGGGQAISGRVSLGVLVAFISYVEMFFRPIRELTESYTLLQSAMASSERIFLLLDEKVKIKSKPASTSAGDMRGEIEFKDVWFSYDEKEWVLKNINFRIKPGEHVAFVGATGAGKTSIISLLSRLYEIQRGDISIDNVSIRDMGVDFLRSNIGVVMQDVFLFAGDIKSNIRLNLPIEDDKVKQIAAYINADKFIDRFPNKYDEDVMERGMTFSMGERQLLSFARVLAFDPKIMILDEATANIDTETERLIQDGLKKLMKGRTSIIVAHRLSTIKDVDRIYVLHRGEVKESGTHQELLGKKGIYYNLYKLQSLQQ